MKSSNPSPADPGRKAGAVLLVDDEPALLDIYAAILSPHFEISTAANAQEADAQLRQRSFKVIVADHLMPGETGLNFLARASEEFPHVQRVLVTGNMTEEMRRTAAETNLLFAFLVKPVAIAEFINVVKAAAYLHDACCAVTK
jgi:DNA-binding NtrC family response regulator